MTVRMSRSGSISILPQMKISKSGTGKKLLENHGGLGYLWMHNEVFIANNKKNGGLISKRTYKNNLHGRGVCIFNCSSCGVELNDISSRGMIRTKCDSCIKEKDRLVNTMRYWMKQVGFYFDLDGDLT